ncbi:hypothetical protein ABZY42_29335 [Streptomyces sp. NPDC006622]|uniref:hypothetical protein n=1 Tax=Streptomyces sp. NPDC006622 TaxID=3155459 RepID=UPI0033BB24D8
MSIQVPSLAKAAGEAIRAALALRGAADQQSHRRPGPISRLGIMSRYLDEVQQRGHGRLVDPDIHDAALRGAASLERDGLGDYAAVLRRDGSTVHAQPVTAGQNMPADQLTLVTAVEREHARVQTRQEAAQFAARHAAAVLMAPAGALPELDHIARSAAPLLPPPDAPWQDASAHAAQLRGTSPAASDATLVSRTDADVVQLLAHALADGHTALESGTRPAAERHEATVHRLLGELARRATLNPDQGPRRSASARSCAPPRIARLATGLGPARAAQRRVRPHPVDHRRTATGRQTQLPRPGRSPPARRRTGIPPRSQQVTHRST